MKEKNLGADAAAVDGSMAPSAGTVAPHVAPEKLVRLTREDDYEKRWIVVGKHGAIDFHCSHPNLEVSRKYGVTGGVEYHHRAPADYMDADYACVHDSCWILGGKCWHDGTSLWASEFWIPLLQQCGEGAIWRELESTYRSKEWTPIENETQPLSEASGSVPSEAQKNLKGLLVMSSFTDWELHGGLNPEINQVDPDEGRYSTCSCGDARCVLDGNDASNVNVGGKWYCADCVGLCMACDAVEDLRLLIKVGGGRFIHRNGCPDHVNLVRR